MFLKRLWVIYESIRTITRVIPTGEQKDLAKTRFIRKLMALPSEGWGWGKEQPKHKKVKNFLIGTLVNLINNDSDAVNRFNTYFISLHYFLNIPQNQLAFMKI